MSRLPSSAPSCLASSADTQVAIPRSHTRRFLTAGFSYDFGAAGRLREVTISSDRDTRDQSLPEQRKRPIAHASTRKVSGCLKVILA